ncbi:hypothetical protein CAP35_04770 [Chitinophagaceae bacterium IBVUCB1]|nr:hypothetical protein CAP35_04770 [Chitinophagaceae bacterium IBVUCB1]
MAWWCLRLESSYIRRVQKIRITMAEIIFRNVPFIQRSFLQRVFKQYPEENAVIELNNLLAAKEIDTITREDVEAIEEKYNINLKEFNLNLEEFYAVYLNHSLRNGKMSMSEKANLNHLKTILDLSDAGVQNLSVRIGENIFRQSHIEAIKDGKYTEADKNRLDELADDIGLPASLTSKISEDVRISYIKRMVNQIVEDQRLSPEEETKLHATAKDLDVNLQYDKETAGYLDKLRMYWSLENGPLPVIATDISLQKAEVCHLKISNVRWCEMRTVRQRTSYSGYSTSIRIAKGIYLRSGSYNPKTYTTEQLKQIDTGTMYITNKRILFTGVSKNHNIRYEKIVEFTPYKDGLEIGKDAGRNVFLMFSGKLDIVCIMLGRLIQ